MCDFCQDATFQSDWNSFFLCQTKSDIWFASRAIKFSEVNRASMLACTLLIRSCPHWSQWQIKASAANATRASLETLSLRDVGVLLVAVDKALATCTPQSSAVSRAKLDAVYMHASSEMIPVGRQNGTTSRSADSHHRNNFGRLPDVSLLTALPLSPSLPVQSHP